MASKKQAAKEAAAEVPGQRGRKATMVCTGLNEEQKRRVRRTLRSNNINLKDMDAGECTATLKGDEIHIKSGKFSVSIPKNPRPRGEGLKEANAVKRKAGAGKAGAPKKSKAAKSKAADEGDDSEE